MGYKVLILGVQSQRIKENLKREAWGLDVGHKDRNRINLSCLRLLNFSVIYFLYLQVLNCLTLIFLCEC